MKPEVCPTSGLPFLGEARGVPHPLRTDGYRIPPYNTDTFPVFPNWSWKHRNTRMETLVETLETQWKHNPIAKPQLLHRCRVHTHVAAHAAPAVRTHIYASKGTLWFVPTECGALPRVVSEGGVTVSD